MTQAVVSVSALPWGGSVGCQLSTEAIDLVPSKKRYARLIPLVRERWSETVVDCESLSMPFQKFTNVSETLAYARGSDQSRDRQGAVASNYATVL